MNNFTSNFTQISNVTMLTTRNQTTIKPGENMGATSVDNLFEVRYAKNTITDRVASTPTHSKAVSKFDGRIGSYFAVLRKASALNYIWLCTAARLGCVK